MSSIYPCLSNDRACVYIIALLLFIVFFRFKHIDTCPGRFKIHAENWGYPKFDGVSLVHFDISSFCPLEIAMLQMFTVYQIFRHTHRQESVLLLFELVDFVTLVMSFANITLAAEPAKGISTPTMRQLMRDVGMYPCSIL